MASLLLRVISADLSVLEMWFANREKKEMHLRIETINSAANLTKHASKLSGSSHFLVFIFNKAFTSVVENGLKLEL